MPAFVDTIEAKPSTKMVLELKREESSRHSTRLKNRRRVRQIMTRSFKPFAKPPNADEWKVVIPGTGKRIIDQAALHVSVDRPIVEVKPRGDSQRALKNADHQERFGQSVMDALNRAYAMPPTRMAAKKAFEGMWVMKGPLFDFNAWPDMPKRTEFSSDEDFNDAVGGYRIDQAENFAFSWDAIDPAPCVWDADNPRNPRWLIESYHMRVTEAETKFPLFKNPNKRWDNAVVTVVEYWSRDWRCLLVDNMAVLYTQESDGTEHSGVIPNPYHYNPYQLGYGVWGDTTTNDPADADVSVLFAAEDWIYEEARAASIKSWSVQRYGLPAIVSTDPERTKQDLNEGSPAPVVLDPTDGKAPPKLSPACPTALRAGPPPTCGQEAGLLWWRFSTARTCASGSTSAPHRAMVGRPGSALSCSRASSAATRSPISAAATASTKRARRRFSRGTRLSSRQARMHSMVWGKSPRSKAAAQSRSAARRAGTVPGNSAATSASATGLPARSAASRASAASAATASS